MTVSSPQQKLRTPVTLPLASPIVDWIDRELTETFSCQQGRGGNCLLELRRAFTGNSVNQMVEKFYRLLHRLENDHFLLGFRIPQWLSLHVQVRISDPLERAPELVFPIEFGFRSISPLKRLFFEQSAVLVPYQDIRLNIVSSLREHN